MSPSDEFVHAWSTSGSIVVTCCCGRTHFASYNAADFDEGELEGLKQKTQTDPEHYIEHTDDGYVTYLHIGQGIVADCACGKAKQYEDFIWRWRERIIEYLTVRIKADMAAVAHVNQKLTELNELQTHNRRVVLDPRQAEGR